MKIHSRRGKVLSLQHIKCNCIVFLWMDYFYKLNIYITNYIVIYLLTIRQTRKRTKNTRTKTANMAPMTVSGISSAATNKEKNKTIIKNKNKKMKKIQRWFCLVSPTVFVKYNFSIYVGFYHLSVLIKSNPKSVSLFKKLFKILVLSW